MKILPSNDRVLILPIDMTLSNGGIYTGQLGEKDRRLHGTVLAVGPGAPNKDGGFNPIKQCKVGDNVIYGNVVTTVDDIQDGKQVFLVQSAAIVAVLED